MNRTENFLLAFEIEQKVKQYIQANGYPPGQIEIASWIDAFTTHIEEHRPKRTNPLGGCTENINED